MKMTGTLDELLRFVPWTELCKLTGVGYYNQYLVGKDEVFQIEYPPKEAGKPQEGYYWALATGDDAETTPQIVHFDGYCVNCVGNIQSFELSDFQLLKKIDDYAA